MSKSRLSQLAAKSTIREYSQGAAQSAVAPVGNFLAPTVEVATNSGYFKKYDDKTRFVVPDTRRAVTGRATEIGWSADDGRFDCAPHALDVPVDIEEEAAVEDMENALQEASDLGAEVGALAHEKRTIDQAVAQLTGGAANIDFTASLDVIDQIDQHIVAVSKAAGYGSLMGVGLLFGPTYFRRMKNHASVRGRFISGGKREIVNPSIEDLMSLFILKPEIQMSAMIYDTQPLGKDPSRSFILDDKLIVFARKANPTRRDPSFMKTFRRRGAWMAPRVYSRDDGRVEVAALDWSCDVQIANSAAGKLLGISN